MMQAVPCRAALGVLVAALVGAPPRAQEPTSIRTYDLRFLVWPESRWVAGDRRLPSEAGDDLPRVGWSGDPAEPALPPAALVELLRRSAGLGADDVVQASAPALVTIRGDAAAHDRVAAWVELLRQVWLEQVVFELHVLPRTALASGRTVLGRQEAEALLRAAGPHPCYATTARVGGRALLQSNRTLSYVRDVDVEVAQSSAIGDPKAAVLVTGRGWTVDSDRSHGNRLRVTVSGHQAEPDGPPALQDIPVHDARSTQQHTVQVQLPRIRLATGDAEAMLADGEAMLFGVAEGESEIHCLRLLRPRAIPLPSGPDWCWVAIGDLVDGSRAPGFAALAAHEPQVDAPAIAEPPGPQPRLFDAGTLLQRLALAMQLDDGQDHCEVLPGNLLEVRAGSAERKAAAVDLLAQFATTHVQQLTVEVRSGRLDAGSAAALVDGGLDAGEAAARLATACTTPCLLHGWFGAFHGRQQAYVADYEVEIAQDAGVPNPVVHNQLTGTSLRGHVQPAARGHYRLALRLSFAEQAGDIAAFDLKDERFGRIGLQDLRDVQVDVAPIVEGNRWTLMYLAPLAGTGDHYAVVARVRG